MVTVVAMVSSLSVLPMLPVPMMALTRRPTKTPRRYHQYCDSEAEAYAHDDGDNHAFVDAL